MFPWDSPNTVRAYGRNAYPPGRFKGRDATPEQRTV